MSASGLEQRIHQLVQAHRPELQRLVDEALEHELNLLVEERRLAARNGAQAKARQIRRARRRAGRSAATEVCVLRVGEAGDRFREVPPDVQVMPAPGGPARRRSAAGADAEPRGASIALEELLRRVRGHGAVAADLEPWLLAERLAVRVGDNLAPTGHCIELGGGIHLS